MPKLTKTTGFQWDEANIAHIAKHNVLPEEAEDIFFDENNIRDEDLQHSSDEERFLIIGKTKRGRLLYQIFTIREDKIRVISSRDINKKEVKLYEKEASSS
ncbi:BrnT family toxin [Candidatus Microgenomates bacterium]|nr:BrnT family toxin [Candidatus Microgenomates bacterium]